MKNILIKNGRRKKILSDRELTVWILTYNRIESVLVALSSLLGQTFIGFNVLIMVDNEKSVYEKLITNSVFESLRIALYSKGISVEVICSGHTKGVCKAKNVLLANTYTDWFVYLEDDAWFSPTYLEKLMQVVDTVDFLDIVAGVAGVQQITYIGENEPGFSSYSFNRFTYPLDGQIVNEFELLDDRIFYKNKHQLNFYVEGTAPALLSSQCFIHTYLLNTEKVNEIGGWDLRFNDIPFAFEEVDVTYSLYKKGYKLYTVPSAEMYHLRNKDARPITDYNQLQDRYNILEQLFIKKHF